jgi:hypothetical protein
VTRSGPLDCFVYGLAQSGPPADPEQRFREDEERADHQADHVVGRFG